MYPTEALEIHFKLWSSDDDTITYRGVKREVIRLDKPSKQFSMVNVTKKLRMVTQNLAKKSSHTDWCNNTENGKITWIFKNDNYVGKVVSYTKNGIFINQVWKLNPDRMVFEAQE